MKRIVKKIIANRIYCCRFALKWTGVIFTLWSIIALFVPFDTLIDGEIFWIVRLIIALLVVLTVFVIVYVIGAVVVLNVDRIELFDAGNNHRVFVQYGDIFSPDILGKDSTSKKRNILISVNRCFDTIVDDNLITSHSLHGIAMNYLYEKEVFTQETLNKQIQKQLKDVHYTLIDRTEKPRGNLKRYAEGSVVEISETSDITYFFFGLSSFDEQLHPSITDVEYVTAVIKALDYCNKRNQGYPVILPLIGGGRSGTKKEEKDILEYLIKIIKLNRKSINCDIHIVILDSARETIAITGLR